MPQIRMRDAGGVLRTITRIRMRDAGGVLRTIQQVRMRDTAGTLRIVFSSFSVSISSSNEYVYGTPPGTLTTPTVNGTVSGGVAPLTYLWERTAGTGTVGATAPTAVNSAFSTTMVGASGYKTATFRLKVTDNTGEIKYSGEVVTEFEWG